MKQLPFYPNREDKPDSCMLASIRPILEHFDKREYPWEEMEELLGYKPGKVAWTVQVWTTLASRGYDIRMIEPFDYKRYQAEGIEFLKEYYKSPKELEWHTKNSNLLDFRPLLPEFLKTVHHEMRRASLKDVDDLLAEGYFVVVTLNSMILNGKPGYVGHMILIHDKIDGNYIAHDPGLPAFKNRKISPKLLWEAMGGDAHTAEVTGIKR